MKSNTRQAGIAQNQLAAKEGVGGGKKGGQKGEKKKQNHKTSVIYGNRFQQVLGMKH